MVPGADNMGAPMLPPRPIGPGPMGGGPPSCIGPPRLGGWIPVEWSGGAGLVTRVT